jgi:hypothetical protein
LVSLLVLLSQSLLFESTSEEISNKVVTAFGVLIVIMLVGCFIMTVVNIFRSNRDAADRGTLTWVMSHQLAPDLLAELFLINTLCDIAKREELWVDVQAMKKLMTASEFESFRLWMAKERQTGPIMTLVKSDAMSRNSTVNEYQEMLEAYLECLRESGKLFRWQSSYSNLNVLLESQ